MPCKASDPGSTAETIDRRGCGSSAAENVPSLPPHGAGFVTAVEAVAQPPEFGSGKDAERIRQGAGEVIVRRNTERRHYCPAARTLHVPLSGNDARQS